MGLLILLAILALVLFGAGFVVKWLFILAAIAGSSPFCTPKYMKPASEAALSSRRGAGETRPLRFSAPTAPTRRARS